jgi:anti-sigma B factor antagonist
MNGDACVIAPKGRLDSKTSTEFDERITETIESGTRRLVINFEGLEYISSAGLRVLNKANKKLKKSEGVIVLCCMEDYIREVFEISGFDTFLPIVPTVEEALEKA